MSEKKWCEHIYMFIRKYTDYKFKTTWKEMWALNNFEIPDTYNYCPICKAPRPDVEMKWGHE